MMGRFFPKIRRILEGQAEIGGQGLVKGCKKVG